ncbi:MAG: hypothetical protein PHR61_05425 [Candidatus Absconditabacteria bacterium]|nr:hypothetical protein [Candidatus Absconditabacteria bacterium]
MGLLKKFNDISKKLQIKLGNPRPFLLLRTEYATHDYKEKSIKKYSKKLYKPFLIETGTYLGEMIDAQIENFDRIYSVEIVEQLYLQNKVKYKNENNVYLYYGSSEEKMIEMIEHALKINSKANFVFWLDGHYSGGVTGKAKTECPIYKELNDIFSLLENNRYYILIDDARCFNGEGDWPKKEDFLKFINKKGNFKIRVKNDIIRIEPNLV